MTLFSVVGHFTSGSDQSEALRFLDNLLVRDGVVHGDTTAENLGALERYGFIFHSIVERTETPLESKLSQALAPPAGHRMLTSLARPDIDTAVKADVHTYGQVLVLRIVPLPPKGWLDTLARLGVTVLEKVDSTRYVVHADRNWSASLRELPFVEDARAYTMADTVDVANVVAPGGGPVPGAVPVAYEVLVHRSQDLPAVRDWLAKHHLPEIGTGRRKVRFRARFGDPELIELARRQDVAAVDLYVPPDISNDHARRIIGLPPTSFTTSAGELRGSGQVVGVADTGVDALHPDLKTRLTMVVARGRPDDPSDLHGHGTHVAGSLAGDGSASGGVLRGVAPGALLFFQSLMDAQGRLTGLPVDLNDLLAEAYEAGARIHNNSWGADATSVYRMSSLEVDEFVAEHPDMLVVIAAGNRAHAAEPRHVPAGFVDLFSIDAPATAKNALTVGASRSSRNMLGETWHQWWPSLFPHPPIADEVISGDPESLAAFSGRGPCQENDRVKPDVVAPGTCILSARSSLAPDTSYWQNWDEHYAIMGGTSMAAPFVAGCAALVREWFTKRAHVPSAALLKATMVNGCRWLEGRDAIADHPTEPNFHQGFGIVDLSGTLPKLDSPVGSLDSPVGSLAFVDTWGRHAGSSAIHRLGETARFSFVSGQRSRLRICLSWTDPPGRGLQHALGLVLTHRKSGRRWLGNERRRAIYQTLDTANNVQVVRLDAPDPGEYFVEVIAVSELLWGGQHFALVVFGDLETDLIIA